eukprot:3034586-Amphidinium_carterae.1
MVAIGGTPVQEILVSASVHWGELTPSDRATSHVELVREHDFRPNLVCGATNEQGSLMEAGTCKCMMLVHGGWDAVFS